MNRKAIAEWILIIKGLLENGLYFSGIAFTQACIFFLLAFLTGFSGSETLADVKPDYGMSFVIYLLIHIVGLFIHAVMWAEKTLKDKGE